MSSRRDNSIDDLVPSRNNVFVQDLELESELQSAENRLSVDNRMHCMMAK
jgi:hypothetical protein